jgi:hypothetical protein
MVEGMPQAVYDSLAAQVPYPSRLGKPAEFARPRGVHRHEPLHERHDRAARRRNSATAEVTPPE